MRNSENIAILDTSIMSFNLGDQIIMESARTALSPITKNNFVVNFPTHSPLFHKYEFSMKRNDSFTYSLNDIKYKFVCGTNLLEKNMKKRKNMWNVHILDSYFLNDFILVGVGTDALPKVQNLYTKFLYNKLLSHDYIHSVRDEKTKQFVESMGFKAINTGCPTIWPLTQEHCAQIPKKKSSKAVFTLTDYCPNANADKQLISILSSAYKELYFWPQGMFDLKYLYSLTEDTNNTNIKMIAPSLEAYNAFLDSHECDYVGTRLHAGIKAIQKFKRSIILGVDNRAKDMHESYGFCYLDRVNIKNLETLIGSDISTNINTDNRQIAIFLKQFKHLI